jgi:hypothetical protein
MFYVAHGGTLARLAVATGLRRGGLTGLDSAFVLRRVRWMLLCAAGILAVTLAVLVALSNPRVDTPSADAGVPAPLAIGTELPHPRHVPSFQLVDSQGKPYQLNDTHGKWIVLVSERSSQTRSDQVGKRACSPRSAPVGLASWSG